MSLSNVLSVALVLIGAGFLYASFRPARSARTRVPPELRKQWLTIIYLMYFFFVGYLFFDTVLLLDFHFPFTEFHVPLELVTGGVFLGGAVFVYIVVNLSGVTIGKMQAAESGLQSINETLEQRIAARTKELQQSYDLTRTILNSIQDVIFFINLEDLRIVGANSVFYEQFGLSETEALGRTCHEITHRLAVRCTPPHDTCPLQEMMETGRPAAAEHLHRGKNGEDLYEELHVYPIKDEEGRIIQAVHVSRDITARKKADEKIRYLAYYDGLTGLPNRRFYRELLARALQYASRNEKRLAILFIDLDGFKRINDTLGHEAGDNLLMEVGRRLLSAVRRSDYVARSNEAIVADSVSRLGGDEFIVMLADLAQEHDAARVADRIKKELAMPVDLNGQEVVITASIGIALYPSDGTNAETLLKNADIAMYHAKEQGKDNYQYYAKYMNEASIDLLSFESSLRKALEREEFFLVFQPKVSVDSGVPTGVEGLIRWRHPERGVVPPLEFIPLLEQTGMIVPTGEWVLRSACAKAVSWKAAGGTGVPIAINISRRQFERQDLKGMISSILHETGCEPRYLELEITESMIMQHPVQASEILSELRAMGIRISVDDFGTGYSSLNVLKEIPLDNIKIDRTFVRNITTDEGDRAIASAIVAMAHSLKLRVIAEGVETEEQLAVLRELGCDEAQGYLFSRPLPAEECERFLKERMKA